MIDPLRFKFKSEWPWRHDDLQEWVSPLPLFLAHLAPYHDPITMTVISTVATLASAAVGAAGTIAAGDAQKDAMIRRAEQERQQGIQALASSQRPMEDKKLQTQYMQSKLQAGAAASGAGAADPTIVKLGSDIAGRGEQQALFDLWSGQNSKVGLDNQANDSLASGHNAAVGARMSAFGQVLGGVGQAFGKFASGSGAFGGGSMGAPMQLQGGI